MPNDSHATTNERRSFDFRLRPSRFALYSSVQHGLDAVFFRSDFQSSSNLKWENKIKSIIFLWRIKLHLYTHARTHTSFALCVCQCVSLQENSTGGRGIERSRRKQTAALPTSGRHPREPLGHAQGAGLGASITTPPVRQAEKATLTEILPITASV